MHSASTSCDEIFQLWIIERFMFVALYSKGFHIFLIIFFFCQFLSPLLEWVEHHHCQNSSSGRWRTSPVLLQACCLQEVCRLWGSKEAWAAWKKGHSVFCGSGEELKSDIPWTEAVFWWPALLICEKLPETLPRFCSVCSYSQLLLA